MTAVEATTAIESTQVESPVAPANGGILSRFFHRAIRLAAITLAFGSVLRWTVADQFPILSTLFYATPPAVLTALAFGLTCIAWRKKRTHWVALGTIAFLFWAGWTLQQDFAFRSVSADPSHQSFMLWNIRNGDSGWEGVMTRIEQVQPPIAAIVEGGGHLELERYQNRFPEYQISELHMGLAIMAKGKVEQVVHRPFEDRRGKYMSSWVEANGQGYRVLIIDLESNPLMSRRRGMEEVVKLVEQHRHEPLLVVGDFNTPRDSVHFDLLRDAGLTHAFESAGEGYANTWPYPLPVLQLDHIWFNDRVELSKCAHVGSLNSDHRIVLTHCRAK